MSTKNYYKIFAVSFLAIIFLISGCTQKYSALSIYDTRLNSENNPIGIDTENPDFSWKLKSDKRNQSQSAYQILVLLEASKDTCWNSGKIVSDNNILVKYNGNPLKSVSSYTWKVKIWNKEENSSQWSDNNYFSTGLMNEKDYKAQWIGSPDSVYSPVFLKEFNTDEIPNQATAFENCQEYYELYVNGEKVGKDVLSQLTREIKSQKTEFESMYGEVLVEWKHSEKGFFQLTVEIPVNTKVDVLIPVNTNEVVYESDKDINESKDIELVSRDKSNKKLLVNSGRYIFEIKKVSNKQ
jgi:hypothetical protein